MGKLGIRTALYLLTAICGHASTAVFQTAPGAQIGTAAISDRITFIVTANRVEIQIENLQSLTKVETQAIASVDFLFNGFANVQPTTITMLNSSNSTEANLGNVITVAGNTGNVTAALNTITSRWQIASSGTTQLIIGGTQINVFSGGSPNQLVIGPEPYNNPNNAVIGHNPFLETPSGTHISFVLDYLPSVGITAATTINAATGFRPKLDFGTTFAAAQEIELIVELPEPETIPLSLTGFAMLGAGGILRRRKRQVSPSDL
jgi:hypothetical protein